MKIINTIKEIILFRKLKGLDKKYYTVMGSGLKENLKVNDLIFFPIDEYKPTQNKLPNELPITVGIKAILNGNTRKQCILLKDFKKEDEQLIKEYIYLKTGKRDVVVGQDDEIMYNNLQILEGRQPK